MYRVSFRMPRETLRRPFNHQPRVVLKELNLSFRSISWFSFLFGFGFWVGLGNNGSHRSITATCELDTSTGWESIPLISSLSRVSLSLNTVVVGEVDELEEDEG